MTSLLQRTVEAIAPVNETARRVAGHRQAVLTKPRGSLGRLEEAAVDTAGIMSTPAPCPEPCALVLAAADHGVAEEGVSAYPRAVTVQMMRNFLDGGAAINAIAGSVGVSLFPVDAGIDGDLREAPGLYDRKLARGSGNFVHGPAMSVAQAALILESGIGFARLLHEQGFRAVALGDMGIGNTTSAAVVTAMVTGSPAARVTGRGTMLDDERFRHKLSVVSRALARHGAAGRRGGLEVLAAAGGYETGFLAGCILGAAASRLPVILDGFPTGAAALIACRFSNEVRRYCFAGHRSAEPGHLLALEFLGLEPLLDLEMRLGEGTGAVLAYSIVRAACRCLNEMATFSEAAVPGPVVR